jgi:hypothetical protein
MITQAVMDAIKALIDFVKLASATIWEAAFRQVYANVAANAFWIVILLVGFFFIIRWIKISNKKYEDYGSEGWEASVGVSWFALVVDSIIICLLTSDVIKWLINPTWYAIEQLKNMAGIK